MNYILHKGEIHQVVPITAANKAHNTEPRVMETVLNPSQVYKQRLCLSK